MTPRPGRRADARLRGRKAECSALDAMLAAARTGQSRVLVVRGEAGIGKSALLEYAMASASDFRIVRALGVESEMELAYAALHQLCTPVLDRVDHLAGPQRDALEAVFGTRLGPPPDRFLIGLAVLNLLWSASEERPLLCVVDDAHWLDRASAQVLGFVARRLLAEPIAMLVGTRVPGTELAGLPRLEVGGLAAADAGRLLDSALPSALDRRVRDRILDEARGNPLALLELPHGMSVTQLAGGFGLVEPHALLNRIERSFTTRIEGLSEESQTLLLVAAAEPMGDPDLVQRAAARLGVGAAAGVEGETNGLLSIADRVVFRHPLVRSAVYRAAEVDRRRAAHAALAAVTDPGSDPDRRAWHLASAAIGPDEAVAAELKRSAGRAQARGGLAAAAAFLQRSVALSEDSSRRADRALAASRVSLHAGEFELALRMLAVAEAGATDESHQAHALLLRGQIAFASGHGRDAPPVLLAAGNRLQQLDPKTARETYLEAWGAALFAGEDAAAGRLLDASAAARALPPAEPAQPSDLLLDGLATLVTAGRAAAAPVLRQATAAFASPDASVEDNFRWGWLTTVPSNVLWDEQAWDTINVRQLDLARNAGALARLPIDLTAMAVLAAWRGDFAGAAAANGEADAVVDVTETRIAPFGAMLLAALRGDEAQATALIESAAESSAAAGQGIAVQYARWVQAILFNGLSRHEQALAAAGQAAAEAPELFLAAWALPELIEAGARTGNAEDGAAALERLGEAAAAADTDWARGVEARSRALLLTGSDEAEACYREAIARLGRTQLRPELARADLVFGEWLRRQGRRVDARTHLRAAYEIFDAIGMKGFGERARRELLATGESVRKRTVESRANDELTAQERQIALLVRDGLSNPEVGARLFLSPRTVEWHLRKIFAKLSISSRKQLRDALVGEQLSARV